MYFSKSIALACFVHVLPHSISIVPTTHAGIQTSNAVMITSLRARLTVLVTLPAMDLSYTEEVVIWSSIVMEMQRVIELFFIARMIAFVTYQSPMENPPGGYTLLR